jgi:hypothetical protein
MGGEWIVDPTAAVALTFATQLEKQRGHVSEADVQAVKGRKL